MHIVQQVDGSKTKKHSVHAREIVKKLMLFDPPYPGIGARWFEPFMIGLIIFNGVLIGLETSHDIMAAHGDLLLQSQAFAEGRAAGTTLGQQAQLDLAWANYKSGERVQAVAVLDRFIKLNPSSAALDYAPYMKGLVNFNDDLGLFGRIARQDISERDQQAARDSMQSFKQLVEQFPDSKYAEDARVRMDYTVNALADYEVHVARYYMRRGAYVAAANRAQYSLKTYPQATANEEGLLILVQAYDKLGMTDLRNDAERVLKTNFPNSKYLSGKVESGKPWWQLWNW